MVHVKGLVSLLVLAATGYMGIMTVGVVAVAALVWNTPRSRTIWRILAGAGKQVWFTLVVWWLEAWCGVQFIVTCSEQAHGQILCRRRQGGWPRTLLMWSNHRCRLDWMYLLAAFEQLGLLSQLKIVLKSPLKRMPIFGWGMQMLEFLFISRSRQADASGEDDSLRDLCAKLSMSSNKFAEPNAVLIFPEGTDLSDSNIAHSREFARQSALHERRHVLYPRLTGTQAIAKILYPSSSSLSSSSLTQTVVDQTSPHLVLDMTIGIVGANNDTLCRPSELSLLRHDHPRRVHIHLDLLVLPPTTTGGDRSSVTDVLQRSFATKEEDHFDKQFASKGCFDGTVLFRPSARLRRFACLACMLLTVAAFVWLQTSLGVRYFVFQCVFAMGLWATTEWIGGLHAWISVGDAQVV